MRAHRLRRPRATQRMRVAPSERRASACGRRGATGAHQARRQAFAQLLARLEGRRPARRSLTPARLFTQMHPFRSAAAATAAGRGAYPNPVWPRLHGQNAAQRPICRGECRWKARPEPLELGTIAEERDQGLDAAVLPQGQRGGQRGRRDRLGLDAVQRFCGRQDGLGIRTGARRKDGHHACRMMAHAAAPVGSYLWKTFKASTCAAAALSLRGRQVTIACHAREGALMTRCGCESLRLGHTPAALQLMI